MENKKHTECTGVNVMRVHVCVVSEWVCVMAA